ncbi:MAG: hemerythrin domain-containing protein [Sedimenticola sp.]|nr:hemerythrin domain-containing protein [Sedimenticola sp.]
MSCTVQLLKWDHARFRTLLKYLQSVTRDPDPGSRDATELLELYTLLKPAVQGRHQAQEAALWQQLREQGKLDTGQLQQLSQMQVRLQRSGRDLERTIRASSGTGAITELECLARPFINSFVALMEMEEQLFPLLENPPSTHHHRPARHGIDLKYRARPQE